MHFFCTILCCTGVCDSGLYLPSVENSDRDSVVISKEDIAQLSDGKKSILSALLPKGSLVIDSVLGEGMLYLPCVNLCELSSSNMHHFLCL